MSGTLKFSRSSTLDCDLKVPDTWARRRPNLAWFGLDELTYTHEDAWTRMLGRLRHPGARRLSGFAVWTPKGYDWVYRQFVENKNPDYRLVQASPRENTHLPADFYDRLKSSYNELFYRQEVLGEYLDINAYDQPGVERGKILAAEILRS